MVKSDPHRPPLPRCRAKQGATEGDVFLVSFCESHRSKPLAHVDLVRRMNILVAKIDRHRHPGVLDREAEPLLLPQPHPACRAVLVGRKLDKIEGKFGTFPSRSPTIDEGLHLLAVKTRIFPLSRVGFPLIPEKSGDGEGRNRVDPSMENPSGATGGIPNDHSPFALGQGIEILLVSQGKNPLQHLMPLETLARNKSLDRLPAPGSFDDSDRNSELFLQLSREKVRHRGLTGTIRRVVDLPLHHTGQIFERLRGVGLVDAQHSNRPRLRVGNNLCHWIELLRTRCERHLHVGLAARKPDFSDENIGNLDRFFVARDR